MPRGGVRSVGGCLEPPEPRNAVRGKSDALERSTVPTPKPPAKPHATAEAVARLRLAWAVAAAGARDGRIPPRLLRALLPQDGDRRALRATLRAVAASAPVQPRDALRVAAQPVPSVELFDALTAAVDMAQDATERRSLEYARASCARELWGISPTR